MVARLALLLSVALLPACASDSLSPPEPVLENPGAFVALREEPGAALTLVRMLDRLELATGTLLIITIYDVAPATFDDARELSKDQDLPIRRELEFYPEGSLLAKPHEVVWFRTLTAEEEARVP